MNVYTITLENIRTGEIAPSMLVRKTSEDEARKTAEAAIAKMPDLRIYEIAVR